MEIQNMTGGFLEVPDAVTGDPISLRYSIGGQGSPILLLHGHPQNRMMWHKVTEELMRNHTVVVADLKGYGESSKPEGTPGHENYSKRAMAEEMICLMRELGYDHFSLMGHDRGARVGYRMALDHPEVVERLILLDVVSTYDMYARCDREFAGALFQWFLFTQPAPLPENMIMKDHAEFFRYSLHISRYHSENDTSAEAFPAEIYEYYRHCYNEETVHSVCEEYRAGECIDRVLDEQDLAAGRKITCPVLALWGGDGLVERFFHVGEQTPVTLWQRFCHDVSGKALPCGHFIPEEAPLAMLPEVLAFLEI